MKVRDLVNTMKYPLGISYLIIVDCDEVTYFSLNGLSHLNDCFGDRLIECWYIDVDYISEKIEVNIRVL